MKQIIKLMLLASVFYWTACVPSINPFFAKGDLYIDENLLGTWSDPDDGETWTFVYQDDKSYLLTYTDDTGKTGAFTASLFKLGGKTFIDIEPLRSGEKESGLYAEHLLSMHTVYLLSIEGKKARLGYLDPEYLKATLERDPTLLAHSVVDDQIVLTATTERLKAFLLSSANKPEAFVMSETIERRK